MIKKFLLAAVLALGVTGTGSLRAASPDLGTTSTASTSAADLIKAANAAIKAKDMKKAGQLFVAAYKMDNTNLHAIHGIAFLLNEEGDFTNALEFAKKGLELDPECEPLIVEAGYAQWKLGNTASAKKLLVAALNIKNDRAVTYDYLIAMLTEEGNTEDAAKVAACKEKFCK